MFLGRPTFIPAARFRVSRAATALAFSLLLGQPSWCAAQETEPVQEMPPAQETQAPPETQPTPPESRPATPESRPAPPETLSGAVPDTTPRVFDPSKSDPKAIEIVNQMLAALGGSEAWEKARFFRFTFAVTKGDSTLVSRAHYWDKWTGGHRLEGKNKAGDFVVVHNLGTRQGKARSGEKETEGAGASKFEESAYGSWVNDTYWLLMPYKLKDPGVILKHAGEAKEGDVVFDKIQITFEGVGLTPMDKYWAYVNRSTHIMDKWGFILKGANEPEAVCDWKNWKRYGSILLSDEKPVRGTDQKIVFRDLAVLEHMPESVFTSTAPVNK